MITNNGSEKSNVKLFHNLRFKFNEDTESYLFSLIVYYRYWFRAVIHALYFRYKKKKKLAYVQQLVYIDFHVMPCFDGNMVMYVNFSIFVYNAN